MKSSEKLLAGILGGSVGLFVVVPYLWSAFRGPVAEAEKRLEAAESALVKTENDFELARQKSTDLILYKEQSLSSNTAHGVLAYQQWLTDIAEHVAGFKSLEVARDRIISGRDSKFVAVRMRITAEGTVEQLREFLFRFHRANVLHRIAAMTIETLDNSSRPKLSIKLTAEAISLRDADDKGATMFPRTTLTSLDGDTKDKTRLLKIESLEGFPKEAPFEIRIGGKYATVTAVSDAGLLIDSPDLAEVSTKAGDVVEYSPINPKFVDAKLSDIDTLVAKNPFVKPAPYLPRLDLIGDKAVNRGAKLELIAKVSGIDTGDEKAAWEVTSELPAGMTFAEGVLKWEPPAEVAAGTFKVSLKASGAGLREPLESSFDLVLNDVNNPPTLVLPSGVVATIGKPVSFKLTATDPESASEKLRFAAGSGAPEGLTVNPETGEVTWTPGAGVTPGSVQLPLSVTDEGSPAQTTTLQLAVNVQDDKAQFTYLTGSVAADDEKQAWLYDRSTNSRVVLKEGKPMSYAGFEAMVVSIGYDFIVLQQKNNTLRVEVGQNLGEARIIASVTPVDNAAAPPTPENVPAQGAPSTGSPTMPASTTPASTTPASPTATPAETPATPAVVPQPVVVAPVAVTPDERTGPAAPAVVPAAPVAAPIETPSVVAPAEKSTSESPAEQPAAATSPVEASKEAVVPAEEAPGTRQ